MQSTTTCAAMACSPDLLWTTAPLTQFPSINGSMKLVCRKSLTSLSDHHLTGHQFERFRVEWRDVIVAEDVVSRFRTPARIRSG